MDDNETTLQLAQYYANLLIYQYQNKTRAFNTVLTTVIPLLIPQTSVQTISFSPAPTTGTFVLSYNDVNSSTINWNDSASTIQTKIQTISELSQATVTGSISAGLTVTFVGVIPIAKTLVVFSNNLLASSDSVEITIEEIDLTIPLAIQNAFNIDTAIGVQLDILGKYAGVDRVVSTVTQTITLSDSDFRTLIKFAIVQNNSGSSLQDIENNLNNFFAGKFIVTDYKNMSMTYIFAQSIGDSDFFEALIAEKLIPHPMAVRINILVPPEVNLYFGYSTYENGVNNENEPYNTYEDFNTSWLYLDYNDFVY